MNPSLPGTYVSLMADVVQKLNVSPEELLEGSGVSVEQLLEPFWFLLIKQMIVTFHIAPFNPLKRSSAKISPVLVVFNRGDSALNVTAL